MPLLFTIELVVICLMAGVWISMMLFAAALFVGRTYSVQTWFAIAGWVSLCVEVGLFASAFILA